MLASVLFSSQLHALSFPDKKGKIVKSGENYIIRLTDTKNKKQKTLEALFTVNASPISCFNVIYDIDRYPEFMPNITGTKNTNVTLQSTHYSFETKFSLWDFNYKIELEDKHKGNTHILKWHYIEGDFIDNTGSWIIRPNSKTADSSLIYYRVYVDPGQFVPKWVIKKLTSQSIPEMIHAIRKLAPVYQ